MSVEQFLRWLGVCTTADLDERLAVVSGLLNRQATEMTSQVYKIEALETRTSCLTWDKPEKSLTLRFLALESMVKEIGAHPALSISPLDKPPATGAGEQKTGNGTTPTCAPTGENNGWF